MTEVACAVILNDRGDVLATQRGELMDLSGKWEFPGGKVEPGESAQQCLVREIREELSVTVSIIASVPESVFSYPVKTIRLIPFICKIKEGNIELKEHANCLWLDDKNILTVDWAEADIPVVHYIRDRYLSRKESDPLRNVSK